MRDVINKANAAALAVCALLLGLILWRVDIVHEAVRAPHCSHTEATMQVDPYISSWSDATGKRHTVHTDWKSPETTAQHAARHAARVAALEAIYPPVQ